MKNIIKKSLQALLIVPVLALGVTVLSSAPAYAATTTCTDDITIVNGAGCAQSEQQQSKLTGAGGAFTLVTNVLLFIIGAISVIMLIIGGIRYT